MKHCVALLIAVLGTGNACALELDTPAGTVAPLSKVPASNHSISEVPSTAMHPNAPSPHLLQSPSKTLTNTAENSALLSAAITAAERSLNPELLFDDDGRAFIDLALEDVDDELADKIARRHCRVLEPGQVALDFRSEQPVDYLEIPQSLLVQCPKDMKFRFALLEQGRPVTAASVVMANEQNQDAHPANVRFLLENGSLLQHAVFESDGQYQAISFNAILQPSDDHPLVGVVTPLKSTSLIIIPE